MPAGARLATLAAMPAFLAAAPSSGDKNAVQTALFMLAGLAIAATAQAQGSWPTRPITLVVPFAAGGPTDVVARTLGASMSKSLGQTVVIENKLGAGGTVAANYVAKAAPDGYTFFIHHNGMATAPALYRKLSFDPLKDFEFVSQAVEVPMTLLARKDFPRQQPAGDGHLHQGQQGEDQPGDGRTGRGVASCAAAVPARHRRAADRSAVPGHRRRR
jgi:hypothetical protein